MLAYTPFPRPAPATDVCLTCQALADPRASAEETERAACFLCRMPLPLCERHRKGDVTKMLCSGCPTKGPNAADEDVNDDWCAYCQKGGDLVCCDTCSNAFHVSCLEQQWDGKMPQNDDEVWHCPECSNGEAPLASTLRAPLSAAPHICRAFRFRSERV